MAEPGLALVVCLTLSEYFSVHHPTGFGAQRLEEGRVVILVLSQLSGGFMFWSTLSWPLGGPTSKVLQVVYDKCSLEKGLEPGAKKSWEWVGGWCQLRGPKPKLCTDNRNVMFPEFSGPDTKGLIIQPLPTLCRSCCFPSSLCSNEGHSQKRRQ